MPSTLIKVTRTLLKPVLPLIKKRIFRIRSSPARGFVGYAGQWSLPAKPDIEERFLSSIRFQGLVVYDIGANVGATTMFFSKCVGKDGTVISFEPHPEVFLSLKKHIEINGITNTKLFELAIGNENTESTLLVPNGGRGAGSLKDSARNGSKVFAKRQGYKRDQDGQLSLTEYVITQRKLDEFALLERVPPPDFIKVDTEGFEKECLLGMEKILSQHHPKLFLEMHGYGDNEKLSNAESIVRILDSHGYLMTHVESGASITPQNCHIAKEGHIFAR